MDELEFWRDRADDIERERILRNRQIRAAVKRLCPDCTLDNAVQPSAVDLSKEVGWPVSDDEALVAFFVVKADQLWERSLTNGRQA